MITLVFLAACGSRAGIVRNVQIDIGPSDKFTQEEIEEAIDSVKERFIGFRGSLLIRLWYDEEASNHILEGYMTAGRGRTNGVKIENVIVLLSDFETDSSVAQRGFRPNSIYRNWSWTLIRDSENDAWRVDDWGY